MIICPGELLRLTSDPVRRFQKPDTGAIAGTGGATTGAGVTAVGVVVGAPAPPPEVGVTPGLGCVEGGKRYFEGTDGSFIAAERTKIFFLDPDGGGGTGR